MTRILQALAKYKAWTLALLGPLGIWGLGIMAIIDACTIPLPYDFIVAGYVWEYKKYFYLCVLAASAGSAIGGLVPYFIGRGGGELFLRKRINPARFEKLRNRFEKQEFFAVMIPSILPPPMPWKLFVFGAGVFRMRVILFVTAVFAGRIVRNSITAVLTIKYGPEIIRSASGLAKHHGTLILVGFLILIGFGIYWYVRKKRRKRRKSTPGRS